MSSRTLTLEWTVQATTGPPKLILATHDGLSYIDLTRGEWGNRHQVIQEIQHRLHDSSFHSNIQNRIYNNGISVEQAAEIEVSAIFDSFLPKSAFDTVHADPAEYASILWSAEAQPGWYQEFDLPNNPLHHYQISPPSQEVLQEAQQLEARIHPKSLSFESHNDDAEKGIPTFKGQKLPRKLKHWAGIYFQSRHFQAYTMMWETKACLPEVPFPLLLLCLLSSGSLSGVSKARKPWRSDRIPLKPWRSDRLPFMKLACSAEINEETRSYIITIVLDADGDRIWARSTLYKRANNFCSRFGKGQTYKSGRVVPGVKDLDVHQLVQEKTATSKKLGQECSQIEAFKQVLGKFMNDRLPPMSEMTWMTREEALERW